MLDCSQMTAEQMADIVRAIKAESIKRGYDINALAFNEVITELDYIEE